MVGVRNPIRIVLCDDHTLMRNALARLIGREHGMLVVGQSADGRDSIALVRELKPDLVVMDVEMPGMNGIDATRRIVEEDRSVRVLALSAHHDLHFVAAALEAGAAGYLRKDCEPEELMLAVRRVATGGSFLGRGVSEVVVQDYLRRLRTADGEPRDALSPREREVLQLVAEGNNTKEIAYLLGVSIKTVETHRRRIMAKLAIDNIADLTKYAIREGITSLDP